MKQLSNHELDVKISQFLGNRLAAHPELSEVFERHDRYIGEKLVPKVKNISKKFAGSHTKSRTLYQS